MMGAFAERANFLFRNEQGRIDAPTWRRHAAWMALLLAVLTAGWLALRPYAHHDLRTTAFLAPMTFLAFFYLLLYAFAVLLVAISYTMLSVKRLRDRGEPVGLAGALPLIALCTGALHFLEAQTPDVISIWYVRALDLGLAVVVVWSIVDLGFRVSRAPG